jgi:nitrogen fixation protein NifQ
VPTLAPAGAPTIPAAIAPAIIARRAQREDELQDLRALLLEHAAPALRGDGRLAVVADTVALACLGDNHLWQDLRLGSRAELSALMRHWFPALVAKNHADMKWKKFFYKQLCERAALLVCRAPSCAVCVDHAKCFGPET